MAKRLAAATVKTGGVTVKIYRADRKKIESYLLAYYLNGRRCRDTFTGDLKAAKERATQIARSIGSQTAGMSVLSPSETQVYRSAIETLKPFEVPLTVAAQEYTAARQRLGGRSLLDAVEYYAQNVNLKLPMRTLAEVGQEMLDAKKADGTSRVYRKQLALQLTAAVQMLEKPISNITTAEIDDYLRGLKVSTRTRHNARATLVTAFAFAQSRGYLARDRKTAADLSTRVKVKTGEVEVFTPKEMVALLEASDEVSLPLIALGGFAGLRTAEIGRLEWKDINFAEGIITVSAAKSKTASRRIVPIQPNLAEWLAPWANVSGSIAPVQHLSATSASCRLWDFQVQTARRAKITWKHNALRHSYGSYRLAQIKNAAEVALEMGNSPQMIFKHYRELVTPRDAAAWWAIAPKRANNVIPMQAKAAEG
ncbi:MAG: tyrosine-type recombinase/integrase [Verrucomicrobia bacterium]|nr:tyrosine-type recombinase/integrase [Verrucomicrobiota bacterium]